MGLRDYGSLIKRNSYQDCSRRKNLKCRSGSYRNRTFFSGSGKKKNRRYYTYWGGWGQQPLGSSSHSQSAPYLRRKIVFGIVPTNVRVSYILTVPNLNICRTLPISAMFQITFYQVFERMRNLEVLRPNCEFLSLHLNLINLIFKTKYDGF